MGQTCSLPKIISFHSGLPNLKERNSYGHTQQALDEKLLMAIFPQSYQANSNSRIISIIDSHKQKLFQDHKFKLPFKQTLRLSILFNFRTNKNIAYNKNQQTDHTSFAQLNIEFSYLASVFYLLCRSQAKAKLLPRLLENELTSSYGVYSSWLFCNGQRHQVIIDDYIPTHIDNFLYLKIVRGKQLWPLILQKSWCKQIGSYDDARGLSPEDAFEEITGVPAYTYTIKSRNHPTVRQIIKNAIQNRYWVALVARNELTDLANRQVFYIQSVRGNQYTIISPFIKYTFQNYPVNNRGEVVVRQSDIFSHFQHFIVGFYKENYIPVTIPVVSKVRQELIFEINVQTREEVSIRFNQFYSGYLSSQDRLNYQYSPVMMELYQINETTGTKKHCKFVNFCQGCTRSLSGARSSHFSVNILQSLEGKYLLRLQVGWLYQSLVNQGNLVIYASEGNVRLSPLTNNQLLFREIYPNLFENQKPNLNFLHQQILNIKTLDKQKSTLIMFHNVTNSVYNFQIDFSQSVNVRLRGRQVKGKCAFIKLQPDQKDIIEVAPQNP